MGNRDSKAETVIYVTKLPLAAPKPLPQPLPQRPCDPSRAEGTLTDLAIRVRGVHICFPVTEIYHREVFHNGD
jgi:hypothetical protein